MDTKTRILRESLALFNAEGEDAQAAIDIANMLDISPGNLYYHFKGKDAIIGALFDAFEEELRIVLGGAGEGVSSIEDYWVYTHILLEEIWDFRFFFKNLGALLERYPDLARRFRRLTDDTRTAIETIISALTEAGVLSVDPRLTDMVVDQTLRALLFWLPMRAIDEADASGIGEEDDETARLQDAVFQSIAIIAPFLVDADGVDAMLSRLEG